MEPALLEYQDHTKVPQKGKLKADTPKDCKCKHSLLNSSKPNSAAPYKDQTANSRVTHHRDGLKVLNTQSTNDTTPSEWRVISIDKEKTLSKI